MFGTRDPNPLLLLICSPPTKGSGDHLSTAQESGSYASCDPIRRCTFPDLLRTPALQQREKRKEARTAVEEERIKEKEARKEGVWVFRVFGVPLLYFVKIPGPRFLI